MSQLWSYISSWKPSKVASLFKEVFKTNKTGNDFLESLMLQFINFDDYNTNNNNNKVFSSDIKYIAEYTVDDFTSTSEKSLRRIDAYFYVYHRLAEYSNFSKEKATFLQDYQNALLKFLSKIFSTYEGRHPNLSSKESEMLRQMNIIQHLSSITITDEKSFATAFALFKLSIQACAIMNGNDKYLTWKQMLSLPTRIRVDFEDFIDQYNKYKHVFQQCPLDLSAYIYLIQLKLPRRNTMKSPFVTYFEQSRKFMFDEKTFLQEFAPVFDDIIRNNQFNNTHVNEWLVFLSSIDHLFSEYLTIYASNVMYNSLWLTFLSLSRISTLNSIIQKHLTAVLTKNILSVSLDSFKDYINSAKDRVKLLKDENRTRFVEIFEQVYDAFISKEIRNLSKYKERDIRELMNIDQSLVSPERRGKPMNSAIIQQLLFRIDPPTLDIPQKLMRLFKNISEYNDIILRNSQPGQFIGDENLKDWTIVIPQMWLTIDENTYGYLCNNHQNNKWAIYIWSRIVNLSVLKVTKDNNTLVQMNDWLRTVRHEKYNSSDILTIIVVQNLFEILVVRTKFIVSLPNIELIVRFAIAMKNQHADRINEPAINSFISRGTDELKSILNLKATPALYNKLLTNSVIQCFLPYIKKEDMSSIRSELYRFPVTSDRIDAIISLPKPRDLDKTIRNDSREDFFKRFIHDLNQWFPWFDRFLDVFQPIIDWLKTYNIERVNQIALELSQIENKTTKIVVVQLKELVEEICKILQPFKDLERLCHLFNCLISFHIIEQGILNNQVNIATYIAELERFQPTNTFHVEPHNKVEHKIPIQGRQNVRWSLVSVSYPCTVKVEYRTDELDDPSTLLYERSDVQTHKNVLQGQFETEKNGQLIITIKNQQQSTIKIWYRLRSVNLSTCHLFHGILRMIYEKYYNQLNVGLPAKEFSRLVDETFRFVDNLLDGDLTLREMTSIQTVFCNKNIYIKDEVKKLFTSRSREQINQQQIEQVCEWLQIYQYYSHITIIIDCIRKFDILAHDNKDETISHILLLGGNDNCTLRDITEAYRILQERFQILKPQHLQLIRMAVECSNVVQMMKKADLYSNQGRSRFQKLRDNLTTQFQFQERNNMILNSWIITDSLLKPFMSTVNQFDEFLRGISELAIPDDSSLNHIKIVNDNLQIVNGWLSAENTTVLDNALIMMENLYRNGGVDIRLCHLINEPSYFEIAYSINQNQDETNENQQITLNLSMADIDDHKRQLAFCNVDVQQNRLFSRTLIECQLKLLQKIEKIYLILKKLEMSGHPDFQLREEHYDIFLYTSQSNPTTVELEQEARQRAENFDFIYENFHQHYIDWMKNIENSRQQCCLLKLFSDRQIMILIILLQQSPSPSSIRRRFLKKLYTFQNAQQEQNDEEQRFAMQCLKHYLSSIKIQQKDQFENIYEGYQIDASASSESRLKKLADFLNDLYNNGAELMTKQTTIDTDQQYLIPLPVDHQTLDINTFCMLINLLNNRLPSSFQILWCTTATNDDIKLFFARIRQFRYLIFLIVDIDEMDHRQREFLLNEQDSLTREQIEHGTVFYFSKELTTSRNGLRTFRIPGEYRRVDDTSKNLRKLFDKNHITIPSIKIVYGAAGIGKTHQINTEYQKANLSCFSINNNLNLSSLIRSFLLFDSQSLNQIPSIYFNISLHAPFSALNRTLFSLFICGSIMDSENGLIFSLPNDNPWKFVVEVPHSKTSKLEYKANFDKLLPLLSIITPKENLHEVTSFNYRLHIGEEEELVARFFKAYENRTIDQLAHTDKNNVDHPVVFDRLTSDDECRRYIDNCMINHTHGLPRNKISELSFTKFLYRRTRFFIGHFFQWNESLQHLGTTAMKQMIEESRVLAQINFRDDPNPYRVFLVYDPNFSLHLLHNDWNRVSSDLKKLFSNADPRFSEYYKGKDYLTECLAWLIDIPYETFDQIARDNKFILTENFAYKLFHVHERKLTRLPLIIEGNTGVGKTFLLKFYSALLNAKNTRDHPENTIVPRIAHEMNIWLHKDILPIVEKQELLLKTFVHRSKRKILGLDNNNENNLEPLPEQLDLDYLNKIKDTLKQSEYKEEILFFMWKSLLTISNDNRLQIKDDLIQGFYEHVSNQLTAYRLIEPTNPLKELLQIIQSPTIQMSIDLCKEYLFHCKTKPIFYRLLIHPGITEEQIVHFMSPIIELAHELSAIELVVFFDEVNTSTCLGLFKEMFMDGTLHGRHIPKNIFFTAAINPYTEDRDENRIHRIDFNVYQLPESLESLVVPYGALTSNILGDYISKKIAMFQLNSSSKKGQAMPLDDYVQKTLANCILAAQKFCEEKLGSNTVSQREIQRCFSLIEFFWRMRYDYEIDNGQITSDPDPTRCIALSLALIYYFRLPTKEHIEQKQLKDVPSREELAQVLSEFIPNFDIVIQNELSAFVNTNNFIIPAGVAINQAVREHIFAIVVSIITRTPLGIIGEPGQSKTLSFQIVLQNLQGPQLSPKAFCKRLPAVDPFYCLGSKYTESDDIAYVFERAIKREQHYEQNGIDTRCVVFLDEASLPNENRMVLKVLHPYLDDCKVAFVAIANQSFDAANANRMICVYRSLPSGEDQKILAYGCLGLDSNQSQHDDLITGLCQGYRHILQSSEIPKRFHDRDFIYMLRELRFELTNTNEEQMLNVSEITPQNLLRALENNFNGIKPNEFQRLVEIFFQAVSERCRNFQLPNDEHTFRDIPTVLRQSMKLDSKRRKLYGRYKLIIDESDDESAVQLLFQSGILDSDAEQTMIFRMSDFPDDTINELRNVEILSRIKLCMETGKTILMVNTGRIHGALYDVFNQNFSIMATDETRKIFSKVAIGPKTMDVVVHENFQCIVHIKQTELKDIPAPFLSRFQKYILNINNFYSIHLKQLPNVDQQLLHFIEQRIQTFIQHFGRQYFYGLNDSTLYSCLLSLIKKDENGQLYLTNIRQNYSQLTIKSKSFIEQNTGNNEECFLYYILSQLTQLVSPESMIYKLRTLEKDFARSLYKNYFTQQEHFDIEKFINQILSYSNLADKNEINVNLTRKFMLFTRTSAFITSLNEDQLQNSERITFVKLSVIENSAILHEQIQTYIQNNDKQMLIIIVDGRIDEQRLHISFLRQLIDKTDQSINKPNEIPRKYFLILVHSTGQELNHQSCFPAIFLHNWDYYFLDTSTSGNAIHLQKLLQVLTSSYQTSDDNDEFKNLNTNVCDYKQLFDDCLWDFCSRLKVSLENLPKNMFSNPLVEEFYQQHTSTHQRFECLQKILHQSTQLQERIVNIYYENMTINQKTFDNMKYSMYQLSKDILCGKRTTSLVDSFQSQTRALFVYFISNILKYIVNDYGLETLSKLSDKEYNYENLLNLIDYSTLTINVDDENELLQANQGCITLRNNYSCVLQTPFYNLLHQRIKTLAEQIKPQVANEERENFVMETVHDDNDDDDGQFFGEPTTTMGYERFQSIDNETETIEYTSEQFRNKLIELILNDRILREIVSEPILKSYTNDTVRTCCTAVEESFKNYNNHMNQYQKTIEFVADWLLLIDDNDRRNFTDSPSRSIWLLGHVYTFLKYDVNDLLSLYSACRTLDQLDSNQTIYDNISKDEQHTRTSVRENIFRSMFDSLWTNLSKLCSNNESPQSWIQSYTFISKYYPSEKVLGHQLLTNIKGQLEFMNLAYLIFLNNQTSQPKQLIQRLLNENRFDARGYQLGTSICLKLLPTILKTIEDYLQNVDPKNSTLMIDVQQWILAIVKPMNQSSEKTLKTILEFLDQSTCQLSLSMKQFLFDEIMNLLFAIKQQNRVREIKPNPDFWDRLVLLPTIVECVHQPNLQTYQLPYHPSVITNDEQKQILFDLFFFHLRRLANDETVTWQLLNAILMSRTPIINDRTLQPMTEKVFQQLKDFFSIYLTALLFSEKDLSNYDQQRLNSILDTIIQRFLAIGPTPVVQLSSNLQLFLSTIIIKRSWNNLLNLLKSERFQVLNSQWSNTLHDLLQVQQQTQQRTRLQTCHRLQFTLTTNTNLSIFPKLHQPYDELSKLIFQCSKNNNAQRWQPFIDWITSKLTANPIVINATEIKVMSLLNIYYDYYCTNQLATLENLLDVIEANLQVLDEERRVFRAFLQPEQSMEGYPRANNNPDNNQLNNLFKLDCRDEDELSIRHALVNLLAMILLAGKQNFLWTFTFQPLTLQNTFGFGSTAASSIQANGVHYDCGCVLTETGDLQQFGGNGGALSVPSVYVAYFSTFGAMALHLLLFNESVNNLYHPVLAKNAINDTGNVYRMVGDSVRAKVCHFVRARLISTYNFLSIRTNESDTCILLNRCFEQLTNLTKPETGWIRSVYTKVEDKRYAEQEYQNRIFYPTDQQIVEYKQFIANLYLQSQVQQKLQEFLSQMPILVQSQHFKTELCNPKYVNLPLNILRRTFDSFAFLRMTHLIYDLGKFYLLLHQTYSQLIRKDEFEMISLRELIDRGQQRLKSSNRLNLTQQHQTIVDNGIKAIEAYHSFSDGLIRPGACDEQQRFTPVSIDTSISYLVTTEEHDEGDIIRRIMSILIDYHNDILILLEKEINSMNETHGISLLKDLINQFSLRQVSLQKILEENTGVISINDQDRLAIECLSRSSLENTNEYFLRSDTTLNFNFLYIQYYLIRSYFLLCPIKYDHIREPYRCLTQTNLTLIQPNQQRTNYKVTDPQFEYLQTMSLEKLYQGYKFLEDFIDISQVDIEHLTFYEFLRQTDNPNEFFKKIQFYEIKDFQFSNIETICEIYRELINNFHYSILNSSRLLSTPISFELNQTLDDILRQSVPSQTPEQLQSSIRLITEFLDDLTDWEEGFIQRSSESLMSVYESYSGNTETIFKNISREIKCENYISVIIKLIETRSRFQEKNMQIEESIEEIWRPIVTNEEARRDPTLDLKRADDVPSHLPPPPSTLEPPYTILFEFNLELTRLTSSFLSDEINNNLPSEQHNFTINYLDETTEKYSCQIENLQQQLRTIFQEKNYDFHQFTIVERNHILIDLNIENPLQSCLSDEYYIIERNSLNSIEIEFEKTIRSYFVSKHTRISALITRFLYDNELNIDSTEFNLAVFDQFGVAIQDDQSIGQYSHLKLVQYDIHTGKLSKLTVQRKDDFNLLSKTKSQSIIAFFERNTTWKQISRWIENQNLLENLSIDGLQYWNGEARRILDNDETISSIAYDFASVTIDGFTRETLVDIRISFNNEQKIIRSFKSTAINRILPTNDCVVSLVREHQTIQLTETNREKSIGEFWNIDDETLHFQISTLIKLIEYDTREETQMTIANNNLTIEELVKEFNRDNDQVRYLALDRTNMILSNDEQLINQKTTKFLIFKQEHICEISINGNVQRFIKNSMLEHVYEQNQQLIQDQYLVYENHFIFSSKTSLELFRSPIEFTLTNQQFPINVIILNEINNKSCQFQCQKSTTIRDVNKLAINLLQGNDSQQIVYNDKFVLSGQTSISRLRATSPIRFSLTKQQKTIDIDVFNEEQNDTVHIRCLPSISLDNLKQLVCQLFDCDSNELAYQENFILSQDTFNILLQRKSSLLLALVNRAYPSHITIMKDDDQSIDFRCLPSISFENLQNFACELLNSDPNDTNLVYEDEFILSRDTFNILLQNISSVRFTLVNQTYPLNVTVTKDEDISIRCQCSRSISLDNLKQLACQLLNSNENNNLVYNDQFVLSQETFNIIIQELDSIEFILISNRTYPSNITITKDHNVSIEFQCQSSISLDYLRQFVCQIFHLNFEEYYLKFSDETIIQQYDISLADFTQSFENIQFELIELVESPLYTPLFQLNTQSVRLTATDLFKSLSFNTPGTAAKVARFDIIYPDTTRQKAAMGPKNVYTKLNNTFQEKKYSLDQYVIVDEEKIFVDFQSEINDPSTMRFSTEYYIVEKVELRNVIIQFQSQQMTYSVTSECQISSILTRFLTDKKIVLTSSETFLGFFDQLGSYIFNDQSISQIYRSNQSDPIRIKIRQYENNNDNLYQVSLIVNQDELQIKSFHPLTTLQEISQWLRISDQFSDKVLIFYDHEQQMVLDENQSIAAVSSTLNGIANNEILTVHLSYEDKTETIRLLKSTSTSDLLYNVNYLRQLKVQIPSNECILVLMINNQNEILSDEDLKKSLEHYSSSNHNIELDFRITILIQIIQYDNDRLYSIPVPSRNLTIEELIQMIPNDNADTYKYLSSFQRHVVLSNNENLSNFNENKFHLINAKQICSISINDSQDTIYEKYANFATIGDIYKQNQELIGKNSLRFKQNFVLASDTSLTCFQHFRTTIDFNIYERNLPAHITITNDEQPDFILKCRCLSSIEVDDICELAYQLFNVRQEFYQLIELDGTPLEDGSLPLEDLFNPFDDVRLKLISTAHVRCLVTYDNQTIIIPANNETKLRTIFEESLEKFLIPNEYMDDYQFSITDIPDIDLELSVSECLESFEIQSKDLPIEFSKR